VRLTAITWWQRSPCLRSAEATRLTWNTRSAEMGRPGPALAVNSSQPAARKAAHQILIVGGGAGGLELATRLALDRAFFEGAVGYPLQVLFRLDAP
jgi:hypothetical protein